ncbi:hypothetical protein C2845_PM04G26580 [Panicum miliaceum]|uniref:CCHC-type domain-containing protein n=1 Tax=Panicum miliaceum TaxID=4540 RepID=A0A3L6QRG3_PANMI|nr:hypothetical protein C2845_PM04G26580 [Panicum miliaceum]
MGTRQGNIHDRLGQRITSVKDRLLPRIPRSDFTSLLQVRAEGRCFNCFAPNHRIAHCRDPPKCILCSRSDHKARHCLSSGEGRKKELAAKAAPRKPPLRSKTMELLLDPTRGVLLVRVIARRHVEAVEGAGTCRCVRQITMIWLPSEAVDQVEVDMHMVGRPGGELVAAAMAGTPLELWKRI